MLGYSEIEVSKMFYASAQDGLGGSELRIAPEDSLLGKLRLDGSLSEDTAPGRLLVQQCDSLEVELRSGPEGLTGLKSGDRRAKFQCEVEPGGKTRDAVLFRLPPLLLTYHHIYAALNSDLKEADGSVTAPVLKLQARVSFRINSLVFVEQRCALRALPSTRLLFPDPASLHSEETPSDEAEEWGSDLNRQQRRLVALASAPSPGPWTRPILLLGSFGTGKTFTLSQAARTILLKSPEARVLICTHSNSAADLYITNYFHKWFQSDDFPRPLRIYYTGRKLETLPADVRPYSTFDEHNLLRWPTEEEVMASRLLVTTLSTAKFLLGLRRERQRSGGKENGGLEWPSLSHILVDEAAQASEPATVVPLALASEFTTVVLAGDPLQSGPACYAQMAKRLGLNLSLLERLWSSYAKDDNRRLHLRLNYRSHEDIVDFLAKNFYKEPLLSCAELPAHPKMQPISFYPVRGVDRQDPVSTGYHNQAEVSSVAALLERMAQPGWWPRETWGPFNPTSVGILCPYQDQVARIRSALRRSNVAELRKVCVEHVNNVQGKEYLVVVVSTVRTLATCSGESEQGGAMEGGGFLSDPRLLNTALTRARALLCVVGDPVTLCTVGPAKDLWRSIIRTWAPRSDKPDFWKGLQPHIEFVERCLKAPTAANLTGAALFFNPFTPRFLPNSRLPTTISNKKYRVVVDRGNGVLLETTMPADLVEPFLKDKVHKPARPRKSGSVRSANSRTSSRSSMLEGYPIAPPMLNGSLPLFPNPYLPFPPMLPPEMGAQQAPYLFQHPFPFPPFIPPPPFLPPAGPFDHAPLGFVSASGSGSHPIPSLLTASFPPPSDLPSSFANSTTSPPSSHSPPPPSIHSLDSFPPLSATLQRR